MVIFRQPGCLCKTLWAFRPILANGLVLSATTLIYASIKDSMPADKVNVNALPVSPQ
jgi:hypothetical protein